MKVQVCQSVEIEAEVNVSVDDITALEESIRDACQVAIDRVLQTTIDEMIQGMKPLQRKVNEQIARFKP
jgi:DNA-binding protein YbaB